MKLIAILNTYISGMAGGDVRFIEVAKRMRDINITVITSESSRLLCQTMGLNANYIVTKNENRINSVYLLYIKRIFKLISLDLDISEGILYSTSDFLPDVIPAFIWKLKNRKIKWVALLHSLAPNIFYGYDQQYLKNKTIKKPTINAFLYKITQLFAIKLMKWNADKIFVVNTEIKDYLLIKNICSDKIIIVDNGVDLDNIQRIKSSEKIYDASFVGRFHLQKGIFDLIKIWELVCIEKKNAKLAIIGSGNTESIDNVKYEIYQRNLEKNIHLLGFIVGDEKIKIIKSSKIFVFPSFNESWGIVIAEAMACGLPVVAYDLPIYKYIYENNVLSAPISDVKQFAQEILKLLNNVQLIDEIGRRGQTFIQKHDWDKISKKELELLRELYE